MFRQVTCSIFIGIFCFWIIIAYASNPAPKTSNWKIIEAIDGDTLRVEIPAMLPLKYSIRISGIDTPEKAGRAKCEQEALLAEKASEFTKNLVKNLKTFEISNIKHDKYGGRLLASVKINNIDVGRALQKEGLARIYHGEKKESWCDKR